MTETNMERIITTIRGYFDRKLKYEHRFDEENRVIYFSVSPPTCELHFTKTILTITGEIIPAMGAEEKNIRDAALYLTCLNNYLKYGNIIINDEGYVRIVVHQNCHGMPDILEEVIDDICQFMQATFFRFAGSIHDIILGFSSADAEIAKLKESENEQQEQQHTE